MMTAEAALARISVVGAAMTLIGLLTRQMVRLVETLITEQQQARTVIEQDKKDAEVTRAVIERNTQAWDTASRTVSDAGRDTRAGLENLSGEVAHVREDLEAVSSGLTALRTALREFSVTHNRREQREAQLMQQIAGLMTQLKVLEQHAAMYFKEKVQDNGQ